jgi:hypothetical protein
MSDTDHSNDSDSMDLEDPDDFDPDDVLPPPDGYRIRRGLMYTNFQYRVDALRFYDRTIAANLFNVAEHLMQIATDFFNFAVAALAAAQHGLTPVNEAMKNVAIIAAGVAAFFRNESILYYYDFMDLVYYPLLNRGPPPEHERFHPKVHTTIDEFSDDNCYYFTGFNKERVRRLKRALRLHDEIVVVGRRTRFDGEELLLYFLYYLRKKDATFIEMATVGKFGGDPRRFTYAIRAIIAHLHSTFYHKISGDSMRQWTSPQQVAEFREAIWNRFTQQNPHDVELRHNAELADGLGNDSFLIEGILPEQFRPFGFLDDYGIESNRVGDAPRRRLGFLEDIQRAFYSGYFRFHGLKAQVVYLPNGMVGSIFIGSLAQNDQGMQNMSGLNDYLVELLRNQPIITSDGQTFLPALYCDGIFRPLPTILLIIASRTIPASTRLPCPTPPFGLKTLPFSSLRLRIFSSVLLSYNLVGLPNRRGLWVAKTIMILSSNLSTISSASSSRAVYDSSG